MRENDRIQSRERNQQNRKNKTELCYNSKMERKKPRQRWHEKEKWVKEKKHRTRKGPHIDYFSVKTNNHRTSKNLYSCKKHQKNSDFYRF